MRVDIELRGYMCGKIWWPVGAKCGMPLVIDLKRERGRFTEKPDLRDPARPTGAYTREGA